MDYAVEMLNITKTFPGVVANDSVDLKVKKGEIHALVGENGAGKSTLMNALYGLFQPDKGTVKIDGQKLEMKSSNDAIEMGIGMVHQKFKLIPSFSIVENICLGSEPTKNKYFIDKNEEYESVVKISNLYGLNIDPKVKIQDCSVGIRQRVEILKTLYRKANILILDEPTSVLTPQETDELFKVIRTLVDKGKTVIFITHKLREVMEISDTVTVLRKGKLAGSKPTSETNENEIARMMVGREVLLRIDKKTILSKKEPIVKIKDLIVTDNRGLVAVNQISFNVKPGEILGIAGVQGNGQTELVEAITGLREIDRGSIKIRNKKINKFPPKKIRDSGISHIPEDRIERGLNLDATIEENLIVTSHNKSPFASMGIFDFNEIGQFSEKLIDKYDIRTSGRKNKADSLSGGNMQKIVVAREIEENPDLLIAAQPTRGVDIGSIEFIHQKIIEARDQDKAILLVSTELDEIMSLSDRIIVMYEGEIIKIVHGNMANEEELGLLMAGIVPDTLNDKRVEEVN